jgi:transcriptional regulator with XRE-family HTH domain
MDEQEFLSKVGMRIRLLRVSRKWSQEFLAEKAETSAPYLGTIERGEQNPSLTFLKKIADAFEIDIRELFNFVI